MRSDEKSLGCRGTADAVEAPQMNSDDAWSSGEDAAELARELEEARQSYGHEKHWARGRWR